MTPQISHLPTTDIGSRMKKDEKDKENKKPHRQQQWMFLVYCFVVNFITYCIRCPGLLLECQYLIIL